MRSTESRELFMIYLENHQQLSSGNSSYLVSAYSFSAKDISDMQNDFVQKQQALQPIKPTPSF